MKERRNNELTQYNTKQKEKEFPPLLFNMLKKASCTSRRTLPVTWSHDVVKYAASPSMNISSKYDSKRIQEYVNIQVRESWFDGRSLVRALDWSDQRWLWRCLCTNEKERRQLYIQSRFIIHEQSHPGYKTELTSGSTKWLQKQWAE